LQPFTAGGKKVAALLQKKSFQLIAVATLNGSFKFIKVNEQKRAFTATQT